MVLILRPADNKVLSISRKKVYCHELMYAKFDPNLQQRPQIDFKDFTLNEAEVDEAIQSAIQDEKKFSVSGVDLDKPDHVLSVKVLDDSRRNQGLLSPQQHQIPAELISQYHEVNDSGECNSKPFKVPDDLKFHEGDRFLEDIERMPVTEEILSTLRKIDDKIRNEEIPRGGLKRGKKLKSKVSLDSNNIISSKRQRKRVVKGSEVKQGPKLSKKVVVKAQINVPALKTDDRVKIHSA